MLLQSKSMIFATAFVATFLQFAFSQNSAQSAGVVIRVVNMEEAEFAKFSSERDLLLQSKQYLDTRIRLMSPGNRRRRSSFVRIEHPGGSENFVQGTWSLDQSRRDWKKSSRYFPFTPEVVQVQLSDSNRSSWESQHGLENEAVDEDFLVALQQLPNLRTLNLIGGRFSRRAIELISKLPLTKIGFGRCSFEDPSLSMIQGMKSLEEVWFVTGLNAEAFIGLSKLPRFRSLYIGPVFSVDFETSTSAHVQQAIRSLDGQFERFFVDDYSSPVHLSVVRALLDVRSLRVLRFEAIGPGLTIEDVRKLRNLNQLEEIGFFIPPDFKAEDLKEAKQIVNEVEMAAEQRRSERLKSARMNLEVSGDRRTDR